MNTRRLLWILSFLFILQGCNEQSSPSLGSLNILLVEFSSGAIVSERVVQLLNEQDEVIQEIWVDREGQGRFSNLVEGQTYKFKILNLDTPHIFAGHDTDFFTYETSLETKIIQTYIGSQHASIAVPIVLQNPTLPHGCEITALTSVFNYYGYPFRKEELADHYLEKQPFETIGNKRYNAHPEEKFIGNPRDASFGMYTFVEPIKKAAQKIITENQLNLKVEDYSNLTLQEMESIIAVGIPIVTWVTLDLSAPQKKGGWYLEGSNQFYEAYVNLHAVTVIGQTSTNFIVMDPLSGIKEHSKELFYQSYVALGSQGMSVIY